MKIIFILSLAVSIILFHCLSAQTLPFKNYSIEDGLAQSMVNDIIQDSKGYMWFATQNGVSKFDGRVFISLSAKDGLGDDMITSLLEDREGNIWFGGLNGKVTCLKDGKFILYDAEKGLGDAPIISMYEDRGGVLWFASSGKGAYRLDRGKITRLTALQGLAHDRVYSILEDRQGNIWFGTWQGLSRLAGGQFSTFTQTQGLSHDRVLSIHEDSHGDLWFGTLRGVSRYDGQRFTSFHSTREVSLDGVRTIREDKDGGIWFGTYSGGVTLFRKGNFVTFTAANGLAHDQVNSVFVDREENIWLGTAAGAIRLNKSGLETRTYGTQHGLAHNVIFAIAGTRNDDLWFGTYGGGVSRLRKGKFTGYTASDGLADNIVYSVLEDSRGDLWFGTNAGVSRLRGGVFTTFNIENGLAHNRVFSIFEDTQGILWFATNDGLSRFKDGKFTNFAKGQSLGGVLAVTEDKNKNIWFASYGGGIGCLVKDRLSFFTTEQGLIDNAATSLAVDKKGNIWAGTIKGLSCLRNGKFENYPLDEKTLPDSCFFIIEDNAGDLWIGTNKGVSRFNGKSFQLYTSKDGLASDELNQGAAYKDRRGYLWFGTVKGVTRFDPVSDRMNAIPPPVYITGLRIFDQETTLQNGLRFKHSQNYLKFEYVGICLTSPESVKYSYKMDGIDKDWQFSPLRSVQYTSLPPARYVFRVKAQNKDGVWSEEPAAFSFSIAPPFWAAWWFRVSLLLTMATSAYLWHRKQVGRIEERRQELENQVAERTKELRELNATKDKLFSIIAHDLKSSLQVQLSGSKLLVDRVEFLGKEELQTIAETLKKSTYDLSLLLDNLLEWAKIQRGGINPQPEKLPLADIVHSCLEKMRESAAEKNIVMSSDIKEGTFVSADRNMIRSVIHNLLLNAIKFTAAGGAVKIVSFSREKFVEISVSDTGVGIREDRLKKIFHINGHITTPGTKGEAGSGLGLILSKEFVEKNGGRISIESTLGQGTTVRFTLPAAP